MTRIERRYEPSGSVRVVSVRVERGIVDELGTSSKEHRALLRRFDTSTQQLIFAKVFHAAIAVTMLDSTKLMV